MAEHREKNTETEYLQRVLAAPDDQLSNTAAQEPMVAIHDMHGGHGKRKETDQAQRCQIGFVFDQRRELLPQQSRKCIIGPVGCMARIRRLPQ